MMRRDELRDNMAVVINWPNDEPEEGKIMKRGRSFDLVVETADGEVLYEKPDINDRLLAILEPHATS